MLTHLYQAVPDAVYALHTADAYPVRAIDPGQRPTFVGPEADIARRNIENTFAVAYNLFQNEITMDLALMERFYGMVDNRAEDLRDEMRGIAKPTFLQFYDAAIALANPILHQ